MATPYCRSHNTLQAMVRLYSTVGRNSLAVLYCRSHNTLAVRRNTLIRLCCGSQHLDSTLLHCRSQLLGMATLYCRPHNTLAVRRNTLITPCRRSQHLARLVKTTLLCVATPWQHSTVGHTTPRQQVATPEQYSSQIATALGRL